MLSNLLRALQHCEDWKKPGNAPRSVNFREEYHGTLRIKSYVHLYNKVQLLATEPFIYSNLNKVSEVLLEPCQNIIPSIIDTSVPSKTLELKNLMLNYFDNSAEASLICCHLLKIINQVECTYQFIERAFAIMDDHDDYSLEKFKHIIVEINSFILSNNPFSSNLDNNDFKLTNDKNTSMLDQLKSMREKVEREVTPITSLKKTSILKFACKRKVPNLGSSRRKFLRKVCDRLDTAAKGTYVLTKDFDTMSRLVTRVCDEIGHYMFMVQLCLDKNKKYGKFSLQIVKELKKSGVVLEELVDELKELVVLCLLTINRARCLVIKEVTEMCA